MENDSATHNASLTLQPATSNLASKKPRCPFGGVRFGSLGFGHGFGEVLVLGVFLFLLLLDPCQNDCCFSIESLALDVAVLVLCFAGDLN